MTYTESTAWISPDLVHRYHLYRRWGTGTRTLGVVGLNPSTADALQDDPTIRREVAFAQAWGYDALLKGNLFAFRATDPKVLRQQDVNAAFGPDNREALIELVHRVEIVVAAWGAFPLPCFIDTFATWVRHLPHARHLGLTKSGAPKHPLYLPKTATLQTFSEGAL